MQPRARIRAMALSGSDPLLMLDGPISSSEKALRKAGMSIDDIDIFEVNEAFAAVPLLFMKHSKRPRSVINIDGGAIAMGHPLGATGAMLLNTAMDALEREDKQTALITLCIGGGMGIATIIEQGVSMHQNSSAQLHVDAQGIATITLKMVDPGSTRSMQHSVRICMPPSHRHGR